MLALLVYNAHDKQNRRQLTLAVNSAASLKGRQTLPGLRLSF
jgi:uncharacterized protein YcgI (DUF1989 family)